MLDFTNPITIELYQAVEADRKQTRIARKWLRIMWELDRADRVAAATIAAPPAPPQRPGGLADVRGA